MPKRLPLSDRFQPVSYHLERHKDNRHIRLTIKGKRLGRPSKRLALHQTGLKILSAKIIYKNRNKEINFNVERINHLPSFQEVRLHTSQTQFPGDYLVVLEFSGRDLEEIKRYVANEKRENLRTHLPSIDESGSREKAEFHF